MVRKWIPVGLAVGLLAAVVCGSVVLASGGEPEEGGEGNTEEVIVKDGDFSVQSIENTEVETGEPDELSVRVAEILGTDTQATHDAMAQADQVDMSRLQMEDPVEVGDADTWSEHAEGLSYMEYGERIGTILGVDGLRVAQAIARAYEELYAVERDIRDNGSGRDRAGKYDSDKHPAVPDTDG